MLLKFLVIVISICTVQLTLLGIQSPSDSLFLFISNNIFVVLARLVLVACLLSLIYKDRFIFKISHLATRYTGMFLVAFGMLGATSQFITDQLGGYIKALDFLLVLGIGFILTMVSLSYKSGYRNLDSQRMMLRFTSMFKRSEEVHRLAKNSYRS